MSNFQRFLGKSYLTFLDVSAKMKDEIFTLKKALQEESEKMSTLQKDRDDFAQIALERVKVLTVKRACCLTMNLPKQARVVVEVFSFKSPIGSLFHV